MAAEDTPPPRRSGGPARGRPAARRDAPRARRNGGASPGDRGGGPGRARGAAPPGRPMRNDDPVVDPDLRPEMLDRAVQRELSSLAPAVAEQSALHLLMVARNLADDPATALAHARVVRRLAGRLAASREALGLALYRAGEYADALAELRTARRMTGDPVHLPVMADCERGLGRPDRALALSHDPDVARLAPGEGAELRIVAAGARRDMGQPEAAAAILRGPDLDLGTLRPWSARLWYAYADALLDTGRRDEAVTWLRAAAQLDEAGETGAVERLLELGGEAAEGLVTDIELGDEEDEPPPG